jgi:dinuclear metal center YbgI/SA1388 family protein
MLKKPGVDIIIDCCSYIYHCINANKGFIMKTRELQNILNDYLNSESIEDYSLNGLQVGDLNQDIKRIVFAVDASKESILGAAKENADALIVHHGLFWSKQVPIAGIMFERIKLLIENNIALFAYHLPLDMHPESGNNIQIARALGLTGISQFGNYHGMKIGFKGEFPEPENLENILKKFPGEMRNNCHIFKKGKDAVRTIGIVSGGAASEVSDAISEGLDCYLTGETSHSIFHDIQENGINVIFAGHYFTETYGVKALMKWVQENNKIPCSFFDYPTFL